MPQINVDHYTVKNKNTNIKTQHKKWLLNGFYHIPHPLENLFRISKNKFLKREVLQDRKVFFMYIYYFIEICHMLIPFIKIMWISISVIIQI